MFYCLWILVFYYKRKMCYFYLLKILKKTTTDKPDKYTVCPHCPKHALTVTLFVVGGQPKAPERMFTLKVQTNIWFDYFQTYMYRWHQDVDFCLDSQNQTPSKQSKNTAPSQTRYPRLMYPIFPCFAISAVGLRGFALSSFRGLYTIVTQTYKHLVYRQILVNLASLSGKRFWEKGHHKSHSQC